MFSHDDPDLAPIWEELHDVEYRVRRIEDSALEAEAEIKGAQKTAARRLSRRHKLWVIASGAVAFSSTLITVLTKVHAL